MMKNIFSLLVMVALFCLPASAQKDENNRIENAGKVLVEILNVPDDIPEDALDKAECIIVLPSVMEFAIGLGGSYGRGVMTWRSGKDFSGPWSAPSMMALVADQRVIGDKSDDQMDLATIRQDGSDLRRITNPRYL